MTSNMYSNHMTGSLYVNAMESIFSFLHSETKSCGDSYVVRFFPASDCEME